MWCGNELFGELFVKKSYGIVTEKRFVNLFLNQDSILLWMLQTYAERRRKYLKLLQQSKYQHLDVIHLQSQTQTDAWLTTLAPYRYLAQS